MGSCLSKPSSKKETSLTEERDASVHKEEDQEETSFKKETSLTEEKKTSEEVDQEKENQICRIEPPNDQICRVEPPSNQYCILEAKSLQIAWIDNESYWRWVSKEASWFPEVAYLHQVCWFDIKGTMKNLNLRPGAYTVSFRVQMGSNASGWDGLPIKLALTTSKGYSTTGSKRLDGELPLSLWPGDNSVSVASEAWVEWEVGMFQVDEHDVDLDLEFSMREVERGSWKGGFFLDAAILRPVDH